MDFYNQFDLSSTHGLSLLDQRHRLAISSVYSPRIKLDNPVATAVLKDWTFSLLSQFNSGRPYSGVIGTSSNGGSLNDTAALQATANTAAGLVGGNSPGYGLAPGDGLNSYTGPWITEIDLGLARRFAVTEKQTITLKAQVFNLFNSANYYVEAGDGINQVQYTASGATCGDGMTLNQTCNLSYNNGSGGFQTKTAIAQPNPPRIMQFALTYSF